MQVLCILTRFLLLTNEIICNTFAYQSQCLIIKRICPVWGSCLSSQHTRHSLAACQQVLVNESKPLPETAWLYTAFSFIFYIPFLYPSVFIFLNTVQTPPPQICFLNFLIMFSRSGFTSVFFCLFSKNHCHFLIIYAQIILFSEFFSSLSAIQFSCKVYFSGVFIVLVQRRRFVREKRIQNVEINVLKLLTYSS